MSSHSRKLAETLRMIDNLKRAMRSVADSSEYNRGIYNGIEMMCSLLNGQSAEILERKIEENHEPK